MKFKIKCTKSEKLGTAVAIFPEIYLKIIWQDNYNSIIIFKYKVLLVDKWKNCDVVTNKALTKCVKEKKIEHRFKN